MAKIQMESRKSKQGKILENDVKFLNSKHDLCSNCHTKISSSPGQNKSDVDCVSKSIIEISDENQQVNT
jgi:hypothetical protein